MQTDYCHGTDSVLYTSYYGVTPPAVSCQSTSTALQSSSLSIILRASWCVPNAACTRVWSEGIDLALHSALTSMQNGVDYIYVYTCLTGH